MLRLTSRLVLVGLLLAATALAATGSDARLMALEARYREHLLAERPDLASAAGLKIADDRLEPITEFTLERDRALLDALADSLRALDRDALAPSRRAALDSLAGAIERERGPLVADRWRREGAPYADMVSRAVLGAATRLHAGPCSRVRHATLRLRVVPELLRSAEINLRGGGVADRDTAAVHWQALLHELRVTLPALAGDCHEADRDAELIEADSLALGAARRFVRFLAEAPDSSAAR